MIALLREQPLPQMVQLGNTLHSWREEIATMWRFTRNNGITEGICGQPVCANCDARIERELTAKLRELNPPPKETRDRHKISVAVHKTTSGNRQMRPLRRGNILADGRTDLLRL